VENYPHTISLTRDVLDYAANDVRLLLVSAQESLINMLGDRLQSVQLASDIRTQMTAETDGARRICLDVANSYAYFAVTYYFLIVIWFSTTNHQQELEIPSLVITKMEKLFDDSGIECGQISITLL
jgi:hypothetical protein